ncbi:MAG: helix-turn-helix transcriptional regulator [Anaerovorax sp.]|nr:helix-turn-helix transcriptional regulator [Anaerovorax sp.]
MTIGERIKELRKELKLNQTEFGNRIGLKQTAIGMYENNLRGVADRSILLICKEFGVSEKWLRNGQGEMFINMTQDEKIIALTARLLDNQYNFKKALLTTILEMTEEEDAVLKALFYKLSNALNEENNM